jgi:hypothetical protein
MTAGSVDEQPLAPDTEARLASFTELVATAVSSSSRGEFHPPALTEPCLTVSRYTALLI